MSHISQSFLIVHVPSPFSFGFSNILPIPPLGVSVQYHLPLPLLHHNADKQGQCPYLGLEGSRSVVDGECDTRVARSDAWVVDLDVALRRKWAMCVPRKDEVGRAPRHNREDRACVASR